MILCEINLTEYFIQSPEKKFQTIFLFGIFVLQYVMEHVFPQVKKYNNAKNEGFNFLIALFNGLLLFIPSLWMVEWLGSINKNNWGLLQQINLPFWVQVIITILLMDLAMYWWHRFNHTQRFLWRFHRFHHRDEKMNTTTAVRFHAVELLLSVILKTLFFVIAGFSFLPILIYEAIFFFAIVVHHSNINIPEKADYIYRKLFSSPLMHRIHHSNKKQETDTNYGSVFSFWDRIFKTYLKKAEGTIVFGVDDCKH